MLRTTCTTISLCVVSPTTTDRLSVFTRIYRPKSCRQSVTFSVRCRICEKWMHRLCERHSVGFTVSLFTFTSVHRNVYFSSAECHFSKSISRRPQPGGSEVCHHAHHVHLPSCFCHWWIRFCGGPIIRRYNRTGLHTSGEGRTREVCTGGEFAAKGYVWLM